MVEARRTLLGLSEPPGGLSLEAALKSEAAWAEAIGRLEVRLVSAGTPTPVDSRLARELTWVAREALTNIVRHAGARSARIGLLYDQGAVSLLVQDDGQGFDPGSGWQGHQLGLRTMTERARDQGANVDIDSLPGDDEMEMGVGIHGEPGRRREKLASANAIVDELLEAVVSDLPFSQGDDVALMVNGLAGTSITLSRLDDEITGLLAAPAEIAIRTF